MKLSIIVPVGDKDQWSVCEAAIRASIEAYRGEVEAEVLACFDLEHRGAFTARNEGLARATGDWIAWVDCDDLVKSDWFSRIAAEIERGGFDVLAFGIEQECAGVITTIYAPKAREMEGADYARWMLGGKGMPHWLWHRVFRRELFEGVQFAGRVLEDYQGSFQFLPRVKRVRFIPDVLYRYVRHGKGLSHYNQNMDYDAACRGYLGLADKLPVEWREEARMGVGLMMTDVILHAPGVRGLNKYVRPYFWRILFGGGMSVRFKVKSLIACAIFWR